MTVTPQSPYTACTVTLTSANTVYNLWKLVQALRPTAPQSAREVNVQISSAQGAAVCFGDSAVTTASFGFVLSAADGLSRRWASDQGNMPWGFVHAISTTAGATINIEVVGC